MKALILLLSVISSIVAYESPVYRREEWNDRVQSAEPQDDQFYEGFFETRIDHFKPLNQTLTRFRYHVNANFFQTGGPIYIYIKDFLDHSTLMIEDSLVVDVAKDTRAALITFDMRFFGVNRPTSDASFENLELLTIEQTLADIATFIRFIREYVASYQYSTVILWGSGHGGSLAVWAKKRYPTIVTAAYASSGSFYLTTHSFGRVKCNREPLSNQSYEFTGFFITPIDLLEYSLMPNLEDRDCRDRLQDAYESLQELIDDGDSETIGNRFDLCEPFDVDNADDVTTLYELSTKGVTNYIRRYNNDGVRNFCVNMRAILSDPLHSFTRWMVHEWGNGSCSDPSFSGRVERSVGIEWDTYGARTGERQQYYLQCTQLGGFPVADRYTWIPQNISLSYHLRKCSAIFGREFDEETLRAAVDTLYIEFSESVADTLYTNGLIDPWRTFGRLFEQRGTSINIEYHSKSADLDSLHLNDPYPLYEAKRQIVSMIRQWSAPPAVAMS